MEPIELTAAAIAYSFVTKYMEKAGEGLGEKTAEQVGKLWQLIQRKPEDITPLLLFLGIWCNSVCQKWIGKMWRRYETMYW